MTQEDSNYTYSREPTLARRTGVQPILVPRHLAREIEERRQLAEIADDIARDDLAQNGRSSIVHPALVDSPATPQPAKPVKPRGQIQLYDPDGADDLLARIKKGQMGKGERADLIKKTVETLTESGPYRQFTKPGKHWRKDLAELHEQFPNGGEVFEHLAGELGLAEHIGKAPTIAPFGLVGSPGVGKSVIVEAIAKLLRTPLNRIQVEISGHASALVGTEQHWSSAGPGLLFHALVRGRSINPVIMLDELEKAQTRDDYPNLHKVLYSLLEQSSARSFHDASLPDIALDASHITWIGTANSLTNIPAAIQSRMRFFEVPKMTPEQSTAVMKRIDTRLRKDLHLDQFDSMPEALIDRLCAESPRRIGLLLRAIYGRAIQRGATTLTEADWEKVFSIAAATPAQSEQARKPIFQDQIPDLLALTTVSSLRALRIAAILDKASNDATESDLGPRTLH